MVASLSLDAPSWLSTQPCCRRSEATGILDPTPIGTQESQSATPRRQNAASTTNLRATAVAGPRPLPFARHCLGGMASGALRLASCVFSPNSMQSCVTGSSSAAPSFCTSNAVGMLCPVGFCGIPFRTISGRRGLRQWPRAAAGFFACSWRPRRHKHRCFGHLEVSASVRRSVTASRTGPSL